VVLEAAQQPDAATAASAGVIAPLLARVTPNGVLKALGRDLGGRYLRLLASSGRYTFELIRDRGIACSAQPFGFINPVAGSAGAGTVAALAAEWAPFRSDLAVAGSEETRALTGVEGYAAALVDPTGGGLDPVAYQQGLADALRGSSLIRIFRSSRVLGLGRARGRWALRTAGATLFADIVVLCANGANAALHPALAKTILPLSVYQVATAPLSQEARRGVLPEGHAMTDASGDVFSLRFDTSGRLITAYPAAADLSRAELDLRINRRLLAALPAYRETPLEHVWKGTAWLNANLLPRLAVVDEGLYAVQACNGRGLALNTVIGREAAALIAGKTAAPALPLERPRAVRGYVFARHAPRLMMAGAAVLKRLRTAA
jgi:glycine/D-amino acid oxidase-like deaminating enzyme